MRKPQPKRSLVDVAPHLLMEWDTTINKNAPSDYSAGTIEKVGWVCRHCQHKWMSSVRNRVNGSGCPLCAKLGPPSERLDVRYPHLLSEWDENMNGIPFGQVARTNSKRFHWICSSGHEYVMGVKHRIKSGSCPICQGKLPEQNVNTLNITHPVIASEWDYEQNHSLLPNDVTANSSVKVYWLCKNGHTWMAPVSQRTKRNTKCPVCNNHKLVVGVNDFATLYPQLLDEWDYALNTDIDPSMIKPSQQIRVHWKCSDGHSWVATVKQRVNKRTKCPYCVLQKSTIAPREKSLGVCCPDLMSFWDMELNQSLNPYAVYPNSREIVHWKCSLGHQWTQSIKKAVHSSMQLCPVCNNRVVVPGFNDLATINPQLAQEWDNQLNSLTPEEVTAGSNHKIWWKCNKDHVWYARVNARNFYNSQCPECVAGSFTSKAEKELQEFVKQLLGDEDSVVSNTRAVIPPYELDVYIPSKNFAIEYNGLYWHSDTNGKDKNYHWMKWRLCKEKGIQLLQVWEDDWCYRSSIIKSMIRHKLKLNESERIAARETKVVVLQYTDVSDFLNVYHIQGTTTGSLYLGLKTEQDGLVAVSVWSRGNQSLVLDRYATSCIVMGGLGKMLEYVNKWGLIEGINQIVTFSAHDVSNGSMYKSLGFVTDKELSSDYSYVVQGRRVHKFRFRREQFREDANLLWNDSFSESELARLNRLPRVWDSGKTRWVLNIT